MQVCCYPSKEINTRWIWLSANLIWAISWILTLAALYGSIGSLMDQKFPTTTSIQNYGAGLTVPIITLCPYGNTVLGAPLQFFVQGTDMSAQFQAESPGSSCYYANPNEMKIPEPTSNSDPVAYVTLNFGCTGDVAYKFHFYETLDDYNNVFDSKWFYSVTGATTLGQLVKSVSVVDSNPPKNLHDFYGTSIPNLPSGTCSLIFSFGSWSVTTTQSFTKFSPSVFLAILPLIASAFSYLSTSEKFVEKDDGNPPLQLTTVFQKVFVTCCKLPAVFRSPTDQTSQKGEAIELQPSPLHQKIVA